MRKKYWKMGVVLSMAILVNAGLGGCGEETPKEELTDKAESQEDIQKEQEADQSEKTDDQKESSALEQEDIAGDIEELGDGMLILNRYYEEDLEDGSQLVVASVSDTEKDLVTVYFDDATTYIHQTIYDGGERTEEKEITLEDLTAGMEIRVYGKQQEAGFYASKIKAIKVEL